MRVIREFTQYLIFKNQLISKSVLCGDVLSSYVGTPCSWLMVSYLLLLLYDILKSLRIGNLINKALVFLEFGSDTRLIVRAFSCYSAFHSTSRFLRPW